MCRWMVFREIICKVGFPWSPVDSELVLGSAIVQPMEVHVHHFCCLGWILLLNTPSDVGLSVWIGVHGCGSLKTLGCCGDSSSPERFEGHTHPQPPKKLHPLAWGVVTYSFVVSVRSARHHVGRWGPFLPAAAMVVAVVTPVVLCAKATENKITILKLVVCIQCLYV